MSLTSTPEVSAAGTSINNMDKEDIIELEWLLKAVNDEDWNTTVLPNTPTQEWDTFDYLGKTDEV